VSLGAVAVAVVLIVVFAARPPDPSAGLVLPTTDWSKAQTNAETAGAADAPVTLEIYSDFQCPYCGQFAREYLPRVVTDYVNPGVVRLVAHDIDIVGRGASSESARAAAGAYCSGVQGKYWQYHDILMWNQAGENLGAFSDDRLTAMAERLSLDLTAWKACYNDSSHRQAVVDETAAATAAGVDSTPTLVLNGTMLKGLPNSYATLAGYIAQLVAASPTPAASGSAAP
jgi:protein-disulfide isomerase